MQSGLRRLRPFPSVWRRASALRSRSPEGLRHYSQLETALLGCVAALLIALPAAAQFGHPLKGTWSGEWGPTKDKQTRVLLEFHWDGKELTGTINPGPKAVPFQKAALDAPNWTVHIEAEGKDAAGAPIRYVIDGKIENIGSYQRVLSGTWTQGAEKGTFRVVRN